MLSQSVPTVVTCVAPGDLTSTTSAAFRQEIDRLIQQAPPGWKTLALDLRAARLVDSVGLNLLVSLVKTARAHSAGVRILTDHAFVRRILVFTRLDRHVEIAGS